MEKDLTTIVEQEELDSVTGTFGFGVTTETDVKPLMSRSYTARSSQVWRKGPFTLFTQPVRNDLIHVGKELVRNEGVRFADIEQIWLNPSDRNRHGWTDSCRHEFKSGWSGMGGYCLATGVAWFYRFSEEEWEIWIHVTESLAALTQLLINAACLQGSRYVELIDNHCVVHVNTSARTRDKRLKFAGRMRRQIKKKYGISVRSLLLPSAVNVIGDTLSRGAFDEFWAEVRRRNFPVAGWQRSR